MTANDAYYELIKVYPQFNITSCYEYDGRFVFEINQNGIESDEPQFDSLMSVDKTTGEVSMFNPMDMTAEEYESGVRVDDWKKDNELTHFDWDQHKYIDKVKTKVGKWRYIYDEAKDKVKDKLGYDEKERLNKASKEFDKVKNIRGGQDGSDESSSAYESTVSVGKELMDARSEYYKTPIGKLEKLSETIDKGKQMIVDTLKEAVKPKESAIDQYKRELADEQKQKEAEEAERKRKEEARKRKEDTEKQAIIRKAKEDAKTKPPTSFDELKKFDGDMDDSEEQAFINENYKIAKENRMNEFTKNCAYCTAAYELRQRGYDVVAGPITDLQSTKLDLVETWYEGGEARDMDEIARDRKYTVHSPLDYIKNPELRKEQDREIDDAYKLESFEKEILSYGDNTRGFIMVSWKGGSGHAMAYEVENGKVVIRDCQTNKVRSLTELNDLSENMYYMRTDHLEPTDEILKCVRNRK